MNKPSWLEDKRKTLLNSDLEQIAGLLIEGLDIEKIMIKLNIDYEAVKNNPDFIKTVEYGKAEFEYSMQSAYKLKALSGDTKALQTQLEIANKGRYGNTKEESGGKAVVNIVLGGKELNFSEVLKQDDADDDEE